MSLEARAISLLGTGVSAEATAAALGVSASRISQLLSQEDFAAQVSALRYEALQKHNARDASYDSLEDALLERLEKTLPLMNRPAEILHAIRIVNGAKRRGQSSPEQVNSSVPVVNLILPAIITQKFTTITNIANQVISAGGQDLETIQSSVLLKKAKERKEGECYDAEALAAQNY